MTHHDWFRMMQGTERLLRGVCLALIAALLLALVACGGGGDMEEVDEQTTIPVNCRVNPEQCK